MIQWPGSDERWTASPPRPSSVGSKPADPGHDRGDRISPGRNGGTQPHDGVTARVALAVPGAPATDGELHLDHRLEPVDVGPFQHADLDHAHGPGG